MLEYFMLGASAVQLGSALMLGGFSLIDTLLGDLKAWLEKNNIRDLSEIIGAALPEIRAFDDVLHEPLVAEMEGVCEKEDCRKCAVCCVYDAISIGDGNGNGHGSDEGGPAGSDDECVGIGTKKVSINRDECAGCGLCIDVCPDGKIKMAWNY